MIIINIEDIEKLLRANYTKETSHSAFKNRWSKENPTCGQCAITSLIVQKYFGGTINRIKLSNGDTHYFNIVNGQIVDLTREQFDIENINISYDEYEIIDGQTLLKNEDTRQRYNLLLKYMGIEKSETNIDGR